ncbi:flavodoxin family protein [Notoacmeibacter sp. MSK16QG-6]|uniref:flavodoxin family protein n=1 Tax=Notoacmeibacter sp. MSK16QG-6 TaxID=2957982 RepID=UPI00209FD67D|nr:flavodoxin family protein [Notoacmeibacter sp. MSK16QG-6]MCP1199757.1 flavodoxin family protein [Notoacmeibacter sp. MSK16QG-6]
MPSLLIVYHSKTGGTRQMVEAAAEAAGKEEIELVVKKASQAGPDDVLKADGYLFATPENLAAIAGLMKDFYDRSYYPVLGKIEGRPYAQMVCAGTDGENAARQTARIAKGWRLKAIAEPLIVCVNADSKDKILADKSILQSDLDRCAQLGQSLAAGLSMGIF